MKVVFILTNHISSCPRAVKEMDVLLKNNFQVSVYFVPVLAQNFALDLAIMAKYPTVKFYPIHYKRTTYLLLSLINKCVRKIFQITHIAVNDLHLVAAIANLIFKKAKSEFADIYIGHHYTSLAIIEKLSKLHQSKYGFDAEDFHRCEVTNDENALAYQIPAYIEDKYLCNATYITVASPHITAAYQKLYPKLRFQTILNVFPLRNVESNNFTLAKNDNPSALKLFWFSQTIGKNRGLEELIQAIGLLKNPTISLHLLGHVTEDTKLFFSHLAPSTQIVYHHPMPPDEIFAFASQFDIGLALELNTPYNRDICLTNKIFTYLVSGLAVIASETKAQQDFIASYPNIGSSYPIGETEKLALAIKNYQENGELLKNIKLASLNLAKQQLNWEMESEKFIDLVINRI